MQTSMQQRSASGQDEIAAVAYRLWEQAGRPPGQDLEFWLKAERQLAAGQNPRAARTIAPGAPQNDLPAKPSRSAVHTRPTRAPGTRSVPVY